MRLPRLQLADEIFQGGFLRHITGAERNDLAAITVSVAAGAVGFRCGLQGFEAAARDIDFGTVGGQGLGSHEADARPTACD